MSGGTRAGLSLSPASEPFPWRSWNRICTDEFVEMRDLLMDNITLLQQLEVFGGHQPLAAVPGMTRPRLCDVTTLPTWIHCFLAYVALRTRDPRTCDMLAYARLLIREAQRHPGNGWLDYTTGYSGNKWQLTPPWLGTHCILVSSRQHW